MQLTRTFGKTKRYFPFLIVDSGTLSSNLNEEQKEAVINIVEAKNVPLPYLLFGPAGRILCKRKKSTIQYDSEYLIIGFMFPFIPGTGKTHTLVAAIEEIVRSSSNCVLVCVNSNVACDEIAERLLNVLQPGEMFRMYAKSYNTKKISDRLKPICNWLDDKYHFPALNFLYQFRVLVATVAVAGYLTKAREDPHFKRK